MFGGVDSSDDYEESNDEWWLLDSPNSQREALGELNFLKNKQKSQLAKSNKKRHILREDNDDDEKETLFLLQNNFSLNRNNKEFDYDEFLRKSDETPPNSRVNLHSKYDFDNREVDIEDFKILSSLRNNDHSKQSGKNANLPGKLLKLNGLENRNTNNTVQNKNSSENNKIELISLSELANKVDTDIRVMKENFHFFDSNDNNNNNVKQNENDVIEIEKSKQVKSSFKKLSDLKGVSDVSMNSRLDFIDSIDLDIGFEDFNRNKNILASLNNKIFSQSSTISQNESNNEVNANVREKNCDKNEVLEKEKENKVEELKFPRSVSQTCKQIVNSLEVSMKILDSTFPLSSTTTASTSSASASASASASSTSNTNSTSTLSLKEKMALKKSASAASEVSQNTNNSNSSTIINSSSSTSLPPSSSTASLNKDKDVNKDVKEKEKESIPVDPRQVSHLSLFSKIDKIITDSTPPNKTEENISKTISLLAGNNKFNKDNKDNKDLKDNQDYTLSSLNLNYNLCQQKQLNNKYRFNKNNHLSVVYDEEMFDSNQKYYSNNSNDLMYSEWIHNVKTYSPVKIISKKESYLVSREDLLNNPSFYDKIKNNNSNMSSTTYPTIKKERNQIEKIKEKINSSNHNYFQSQTRNTINYIKSNQFVNSQNINQNNYSNNNDFVQSSQNDDFNDFNEFREELNEEIKYENQLDVIRQSEFELRKVAKLRQQLQAAYLKN